MQKKRRTKKIIQGIYYNDGYLNGPNSSRLINELEQFHPIWEERFSKSNPPPEGDTWRSLKRPVYWLGNWQFACLGYYHPPLETDFKCVEAEEFPEFMQELVHQIEEIVHRITPKADIPQGWTLNTCLINYYGSTIIEDGKEDQATVGDHKDAEPGPVASISLGEKAWFQFVKGKAKDKSNIVHEQWLTNNSLLVFWGKKFKDDLFHRVQRVQDTGQYVFEDYLDEYQTRRINLTFRYVPQKDILPYSTFPKEKKEDIKNYVQNISKNSIFFKKICQEENYEIE